MQSRRQRIERVQAQWARAEWSDIATFIGPNAGRFRATWSAMSDKIALRGHGISWSFSTPALVFGFAWFLGRRMWAVGVLLFVLPLLLAITMNGLPAGGMIGTAVAFAIIGKSIYIHGIVPKVARIVAATGPGPERDARLRNAGGVSLPAATIGGVLLTVQVAAAISTVWEMQRQ